MIDDPQMDLIHRVLDGDVTPEERVSFEALVAQQPEARQLYEDLKATAELLAQVETAAPSPDLKRRILQALPTDRYARPARQRSSLAGIAQVVREAFAARPALAYAYVAILGVAIGVGAYAVLDEVGRGPDASETYGTMIAPSVTQTFSIDASEAPGTVRVTRGGDRLIIELDLAPETVTEAQFTFDPEALHWQGLTQLNEGPAAGLTTSEGAVRLTFSGPARYRLSFDRIRTPLLTLTLSQGDRTLYRQQLMTTPDEQE